MTPAADDLPRAWAAGDATQRLRGGSPPPGCPRTPSADPSGTTSQPADALEVGHWLADCRLLATLGQGVEGRVFLAVQPALGERLVVLKITPRAGAEHQALGGLFHTHIVPLLFALDLPDRDLRVLAMPYLGGGPLSALLDQLGPRTDRSRSGRTLLEALDAHRADQPLPLGQDRHSSLRERIAGIDHVSLVCWLGTCLADALHHAHERGLVHLDVKPSNVLLAWDGLPLLLDFHLARAPLLAGTRVDASFGGTPGFMSPEQAEAVEAIASDRPVPRDVGPRADLFSLGVVLYQLLGGELPRSQSPRQVARDLLGLAPEVGAGLADVVARCLAPHPAQRYPHAAALAGDLRRHLNHQPLLGVPNRDPLERWKKWRRRNAGRFSRLGACLLGLVALTSSLAFAGLHSTSQHRQAAQALAEGRQLLAQGDARAAEHVLRHAKVAGWFPGAEGLRLAILEEGDRAAQRVRSQQRTAERDRLVSDLARLADDLRLAWDHQGLDPTDSKRLERRATQLWARRDRLFEGASLAMEVRRDLLELASWWDERPGRTTGSWVQELERIQQGSTQASSRSAESYRRGRALMRAGRFAEAEQAFVAGLTEQPDGLWLHFYQGVCAYRQEHFREALAAFRTCLALAPRSAPCHVNRALAHLALGDRAHARADLDRALQLDSSLAAAWLQRGMLFASEGRLSQAAADLREALARGAPPAPTRLQLARVYLRQGERSLARHQVEEALRLEPEHPGAREMLALWKR